VDFRQFADMLERGAAESPAAASAALKLTLDAVTVEARAAFGHELPEWAPLSQATLQGFRHPRGFYIPGKIELGYVGHKSATDPLLRTGATRDSIENTVGGLEGVVGSPSKIALFQELGTHNAETGDIPPRPTIGLAASRSAPIAEIFFGQAAVRLLSPRNARVLGGGRAP
jgi:hypothetical protein